MLFERSVRITASNKYNNDTNLISLSGYSAVWFAISNDRKWNCSISDIITCHDVSKTQDLTEMRERAPKHKVTASNKDNNDTNLITTIGV